jgi:hypothetical protein
MVGHSTQSKRKAAEVTRKTKKPQSSRKPHNAKKSEFVSFGDLLGKVATEVREVQVGDDLIEMPRVERLIRLTLARALKGNVRDVAKMLNLMAQNPELAATHRERTVIHINPALYNA